MYTVPFSKQIKKNLNQTNWWILQCITTNWRSFEGFMRRIIWSLFVLLGVGIAFLFLRITIFIYQDFASAVMTQQEHETKWNEIKSFQWPWNNFTYAEFKFNTSLNIVGKKKDRGKLRGSLFFILFRHKNCFTAKWDCLLTNQNGH